MSQTEDQEADATESATIRPSESEDSEPVEEKEEEGKEE